MEDKKEEPKKEEKKEEPKKEEEKKEEPKKEEEKKEEPKKEEEKKEEPKKEDKKEEDKKVEDKKVEDKKEENKIEDKKEAPTIDAKKEEPKKEKEKKEDDNEIEKVIKTKVDENIGIKNAVEEKDLNKNAKSWEDLGIKDTLLKALLDMDFVEPSPIQSLAFPLIMKEPRLSLVAQAKNGSGKTCAFGLGVISTVDENINDIQAVILAPNRELVIQISGVLEKMAKHSKIKCVPVLVGEHPNEYGQIMVTTPCHFENIFLKNKNNKALIQKLKIMVLDEADDILKNETTSPAVKRAFATFKKENMNVQVLFFSATFTIKCFKSIKDFYKEAYMIEIKKEELTLKNVTQYYQECKSPEDKINFIDEYLRISTGSQKVIIFVNEKRYVLQLKEKLEQRGRKVFILMGGDMSHSNRDETIRRFRKGEIQILITTNLLARGYDERSVKLVINFDLPVRKNKEGHFEPDYETYLHRIGRTGRFGTKGIGLNLCCFKYDYINLQKIEKFYVTKIDKMKSLDDLLQQLKNFYLEDS